MGWSKGEGGKQATKKKLKRKPQLMHTEAFFKVGYPLCSPQTCCSANTLLRLCPGTQDLVPAWCLWGQLGTCPGLAAAASALGTLPCTPGNAPKPHLSLKQRYFPPSWCFGSFLRAFVSWAWKDSRQAEDKTMQHFKPQGLLVCQGGFMHVLCRGGRLILSQITSLPSLPCCFAARWNRADHPLR